MHVQLISKQEHWLKVLYTAYKVCYSSKSYAAVVEEYETAEYTDIIKFIKDRLVTNHWAPVRQLNFVFYIEGISRVTSAQLRSHSVGVNRTERSQRHVIVGNNSTDFIIPEVVKGGRSVLNDVKDVYNENIQAGVAKEDARYILPMGSTTSLQISFSFEALVNFCRQRLCFAAQKEIRLLASSIQHEVVKACPVLADYLVRACDVTANGYCKEPYNVYAKCKLSKIKKHHTDILTMLTQKNKEEI